MEEASGTARKQAPGRTRWRLLSVLIVAALFVIGTVQALTGSKGFVTTEMDEEHLGVSGTYGDPVFWKLDTISDIQLVDPFDFGTCIDGEETGNTVSGRYFCEELGECTVHAYTNGSCIIVRSPDGVLVFNCGSDSLTQKRYDQLVEACF